MNNTPKIPDWVWRLLFAAVLLVVFLMTEARAGDCGCAPRISGYPAQAASWIFSQGRYTHDLATGDRVAQYAMKPPVEPLPDARAITSGYRRTRTVLRGADGSADTSYQVQSYGNARGGMDAAAERSHDARRGLGAGGYNPYSFPQWGFGGGFSGYGGPGYGYGGPGYGGYYPPRYSRPGFRDPRQQYGPGYGRPDAGLLDPDAADGYHDGRRRTPDRQFFNQAVPTP